MEHKMRLSIGITSYGRPECLNVLLKSFENINFDFEYEIIFVESNKNSNGESCVKIMNEFDCKNKHILHLSKNVGFFSAWNIMTNLFEGEFHLMLQDDMVFCKKDVIFSNILKYMDDNKIDFLSLRGAGKKDSLVTDKRYSDWVHLERKNFRLTYGDYHAYPKYYRSLKDQSTKPEPEYSSRILGAGAKLYNYYERICIPQQHNNSLYQTLLHNVSKINMSEEDKIKIWNDPDIDKIKEICKKYNTEIYGSTR